jgi:tRNA uridine 5-carboxymethylaminomethyl modification enzyme
VLDEVSELIVKNKIICGIKTLKHGIILAKKVIITTGTYMNSLTHIGLENFKSGPDIEIDNKKRFLPSGYKRSNFLSDNIKKLGFKLIRLKTGTPPRIKSDSINYKLI